MIIRRAFFVWLFPSALILPLWLFAGWILFGEGGGWSLLGTAIAAPIMFVCALIVAALLSVRPDVRTERALSWKDVLFLSLWNMSVILGVFVPARQTFTLFLVSGLLFIALIGHCLKEIFFQARVVHVQGGAQTSRPGAQRNLSSDSNDAQVIVIQEKPNE